MLAPLSFVQQQSRRKSSASFCLLIASPVRLTVPASGCTLARLSHSFTTSGLLTCPLSRKAPRLTGSKSLFADPIRCLASSSTHPSARREYHLRRSHQPSLFCLAPTAVQPRHQPCRATPAAWLSPLSTASSTPTTSTHNQMDTTRDIRSKRKQPPVNSPDRPTKHLRSQRSDMEPVPAQNGSDLSLHSQANGTMAQDEDHEEIQALSRAATTGETAEWQATIEKVVKNVVSIHFCMTCSFDTETALASEATGFVVDAERGYILTNRVWDLMALDTMFIMADIL